MAKTQKYLVGVDGSEWGIRASDRAVSLAKQTGAEVVFFTVIPWSGFTPMSLEAISTRPIEKSEEEKQAQADILQPLLDRHADSGVTVSGDYTWGHPVESMHEKAKVEKVNLVFVGRRGRSRLADLVMGSVSNSLAHTIGVPIVLVP